MPLGRKLLENAASRSAVPKAVFGLFQGRVMAPSSSQSSGGCCCGGKCSDLPPSDDNARFALLALLMATYLLCGAGVFSVLEHPMELENQRRWNRTLSAFAKDFEVSPTELRRFLKEYELAMAAGVRVEPLKPRWDFSGALYFVGTVVSTIGFGMTTPATTTGKIFLIFYGMIGCSSTILFFNLFLERIITLLGVTMRTFRLHQLRSRGVFPNELPTVTDEERGHLSGWKPSVYNVMLILGLCALVISCCASAMYSPKEGWSYVDSLYFCFVTFSTIGFGDLVSGQRRAYEGHGLYGAGNFIFILLGVCCIYSLFNVISIVIKQVLNWLLRRCCPCWRVRGHHRTCRRAGRRHHRVVAPNSAGHPPRSEISMDTEAVYESEADARRTSPEPSVGCDFSSATAPGSTGKATSSEVANGHLKVAWKDQSWAPTSNNAYEAAECDHQRGLLSDIGSLAVMNNKLAETSGIRCHGGLASSMLVNGRLLDGADHNRLSSCQSSPTSIHKSRSRRTVESSVVLKEENSNQEAASSSGVESLTTNANIIQAQGSNDGDQIRAASSGVGSSSLQACSSASGRRVKLRKQYSEHRDDDFPEPECSNHGWWKGPATACTEESGPASAMHPRSLAFLNRKLIQSSSVDSAQDCTTGGRITGLRKSWFHNHRPGSSTGELLKDVGSLAVMNDKFAETTRNKKAQTKSKVLEELDDT